MKAINRSELPVGTYGVLGDGINDRFNNDLPGGGEQSGLLLSVAQHRPLPARTFCFNHSTHFTFFFKESWIRTDFVRFLSLTNRFLLLANARSVVPVFKCVLTNVDLMLNRRKVPLNGF